MDLMSPSFWLELAKAVGEPAVFAFMLWLFLRSNERRGNAHDKIRENDRSEHAAKWTSMISEHKEERDRHREELDRLLRLYERQTSAIELQASLSVRMNELITTNQFCPAVRKKEGF